MAVLIPCAARLKPEFADVVTLESPWEAFVCTLEAVSFVFAAVFAAVSLAASVVEACRLVVWRAIKRVCRSIDRWGATADMKLRSPSFHRLDLSVRKGTDFEDLGAAGLIKSKPAGKEQKIEELCGSGTVSALIGCRRPQGLAGD